MLSPAFTLQLVQANGNAYEYLQSPALKSNADIALAAYQTAPNVVRNHCGALNDNKEFVCKALRMDKSKALWISARLQKDKEVLAIIGKNAIRREKQKNKQPKSQKDKY